MKILVTGGCGYIGSAVCVELLLNNHDVIIVDDLRNSKIETLDRIESITGKHCLFYKVNLLNYNSLKDIFKNHKIDAVMHFAGSKSIPESHLDPILYYQNNVMGTINLLKTMQSANVYKLIFSSSAAVYGNSKNSFKEDSPLNPAHTYGKTKMIIEDILQDLCKVLKDWNITVLRYFNPVGAHPSGKLGEDSICKLGNLFPAILKVINGESDKILIYGNNYNTRDGTCIRDFIHISDLAMGHINALNKIGTPKNYNIYNLGVGINCTILEIIECFESVIGKSIPIEFTERRIGDVEISFANPSKAYRELNWKETKNSKQICEDSLRWELTKKNLNCKKL